MKKGNNLGVVLAFGLGLSSQAVWAADPPSGAGSAEKTPVEAPPATRRADTLFNEGKQLMDQGKFVEACDKLAESDGLDPAIGTLGLLAACHEQQGRIATAWREYTQTALRAEAVGDEDRASFARQRAKELEPTVPKLLVRLVVVDAQVVVLRNGVRFLPEELGKALAVDPGTYEIVVRYPGKPEYRATVMAAVRQVAEVEVPNPQAVPDKQTSANATSSLRDAKSTPVSGQKVGAFVAGGVGLLGFGMATAFAISASSKNNASISIHETCTSAARCEEGKRLRDEALGAATAANVGVGIGVVGAGAAIVFALLPNRSSASVSDAKHARLVPWAGPDAAGALIIGHF